ncbi:hypothetical protein C8R43DRAFT_943269 [Mycena crocata]|nr:hypothetical protein C8R43DRAFT_943269 [Mycena crocata]
MMPPQPTSLTQTRLNNIITGFTGVVNTLEVLADAFKVPFLDPITKTTQSLLKIIQTVKQNKTECANLIVQASNVLYAIISIYIKSTTGLDLPPSILNHIGKFMETLNKIHSYVEAQQDKIRIRQFFRQSELSTLFKACTSGLKDALHVFKKYAEEKHQEVLQMIEALSENTTSDRGSLRTFSTLDNSSTSISMLPSEPKIFYGRENELSHILELFVDRAPRVAILGPGVCDISLQQLCLSLDSGQLGDTLGSQPN